MNSLLIYLLPFGLLGLAFLFSNKNKHHHSITCVVLASIIIIFAQLNSLGVPLFNLTIEQIFCWVFGFCSFALAGFFGWKKELAYGFIIFVIAALSCFCGLSGVQALLKTHLLMTVTGSLKGYGDKLDNYQTTVADMQDKLIVEQSILQSNQITLSNSFAVTKYKLETVQDQIQQAQTIVLNQQSTNTIVGIALTSEQTNIDRISAQLALQEYKLQIESIDITGQQMKLDNEQTNLDIQQKKIQTVEATVNKLYSVIYKEEFDISDTNRVYVVKKNPALDVVYFKLKYVPIQNSIETMATLAMHLNTTHTVGILDLPFLRIAKTMLFGEQKETTWNDQFPIMALDSFNNIAYGFFGVNGGKLPSDLHFTIRYAKDVEDTNIINKIEIKNDKLWLNGGFYFDVTNK